MSSSSGIGNLHPAIATSQVDSQDRQPALPNSSSSSAPAAAVPRSSSRGRATSNEAMTGEASGSGSHPRSSGGSGGLSNIPLPSPSAVHINQSLEDSLRRGEEERLRRSAERRERRRRRIEQSNKTKHASQSSGRASGSGKAREGPILEEPLELSTASPGKNAGDASIDSSLHDDESALVTSPILGTGETNDHQQPDDNIQIVDNNATTTSSDEQGPYYREGYGDIDGYYDDSELEDYDGRSLTRQLAETAVSVREMSRELGRARVKSNVQSVLIVTKARDNQLIKLTREIALYLMKTPRYGRNRGIVVYVDSQLKTSKRFDAAGIERDHPHLFRTESRHHHHHSHHHHHHHHGHHNRDPSLSQQQSTASGTGTPRRSSSRRASNNSSGTSSLNLFGMTRATDLGGSTASLSALDRPGYLSSQSAQTSGSNTPAPGYPKPMTKLTEALVTRQIDRQLEKENARRQSQGAAGAQGLNGTMESGKSQRVAFSTTGTPGEPASNAGGGSGDEQSGLLRYWTAEMCSKSPQLFDLVLTLGGDGTVLFTSWLFQHVVPPVIPFALGSLGFLTNFDFSDYKDVLEMAINEGVRVNLRMRFTATIYRAVPPEEHNELTDKRTRVIRSGETGQLFLETAEPGQWTKLESHAQQGNNDRPARQCKDKEVRCAITRPVESFEVLNDLVVDRGPSPYVSLLELFGDEHHLTTVQADGLCVATPTGSTAYSLSAGGSLVHPEIPTLLITPICPHTLSFRPMLLPDSMELRIAVPYNSRSTAWASFDGRGRVELRQGDHIKVTASTYPFPTVCADKQSTDWFQAITRTLKWNERQRQKSFVVLEHDRTEPHDSARSKAQAEEGNKANATGSDAGSHAARSVHPDDHHVVTEAEEEDDGRFDIDDLSSSGPVSATVSEAGQDRTTPVNNVPFAFGGAQASSRWQPGSPVVMPPDSTGFSRAEGPQSPSEHDVSHSSANHLRQYATYSRDSGNGSSSRNRTPRAADSGATRPSVNFSAASDNSRPRSRNSVRRSHRIHGKSGADRVKAFVVFGADSSDFDTSSSGDDTDDTTVRPGRRT
ncbi:hypothetical protein P389DRAFT_9662 [Cystobasidium minutum MCA 4210]|uniref:uncharacterized protein n=1 Tax=Cystobasidium minutum MCA 4210 TaxID=1397322 RepID=UPI0034CFAC90|eukprot:jgi/Rhomi1/9662/CE9661_2113